MSGSSPPSQPTDHRTTNGDSGGEKLTLAFFLPLRLQSNGGLLPRTIPWNYVRAIDFRVYQPSELSFHLTDRFPKGGITIATCFAFFSSWTGQIIVPRSISHIRRILMVCRYTIAPLLEVDLSYHFNMGARHPRCSSFCKCYLLHHYTAWLI